MVTPVGWLERVPTYKDKRDSGVQKTTSRSRTACSVIRCCKRRTLSSTAPTPSRSGRDQAAHIEISREIARRFNRIVGRGRFPGAGGGDQRGYRRNARHGRAQDEQVVRQRHLSCRHAKSRRRRRSTRRSRRRRRSISPTPAFPKAASPASWRRVYDPANYQTQWDECRAGLRGCGQSKKELAEIVNANLAPLRARRAELEADPGYVDTVLREGAERARAAAARNHDKSCADALQLA